MFYEPAWALWCFLAGLIDGRRGIWFCPSDRILNIPTCFESDLILRNLTHFWFDKNIDHWLGQFERLEQRYHHLWLLLDIRFSSLEPTLCYRCFLFCTLNQILQWMQSKMASPFTFWFSTTCFCFQWFSLNPNQGLSASHTSILQACHLRFLRFVSNTATHFSW